MKAAPQYFKSTSDCKIPTFMCFWCQQTFPICSGRRKFKTLDHVVPVLLNGGRGANLVVACHSCNQERSKITDLYSAQKFLERTLEKIEGRWHELDDKEKRRIAKMTRSFNARFDLIVSIREKWIRLEKERLGLSPSSKMKFHKFLVRLS